MFKLFQKENLQKTALAALSGLMVIGSMNLSVFAEDTSDDATDGTPEAVVETANESTSTGFKATESAEPASNSATDSDSDSATVEEPAMAVYKADDAADYAAAVATLSDDSANRIVVSTEDDLPSMNIEGKAVYYDGTYVISVDDADKASEAKDTLANAVNGETVQDEKMSICDTDEAKAEEITNEINQSVADAAKEGLEIETDKKLIAVIDTGVNNEYATESVNLTDDANFDVNGHGTKIAKLILDNANEKAEILSIKAFNDDGTASLANVTAAVQYAVEAGVDIINISASIKDSDNTAVFKETIQKALDAGITVVASAGNAHDDAANYAPANIEGVITVGSVVEGNALADFSNYGECVDYYVVSSSTSEAAAILTGKLAADADLQNTLSVLKALITEADGTAIEQSDEELTTNGNSLIGTTQQRGDLTMNYGSTWGKDSQGHTCLTDTTASYNGVSLSCTDPSTVSWNTNAYSCSSSSSSVREPTSGYDTGMYATAKANGGAVTSTPTPSFNGTREAAYDPTQTYTYTDSMLSKAGYYVSNVSVGDGDGTKVHAAVEGSSLVVRFDADLDADMPDDITITIVSDGRANGGAKTTTTTSVSCTGDGNQSQGGSTTSESYEVEEYQPASIHMNILRGGIKLTKYDEDRQTNIAQGDASLSGALFDIFRSESSSTSMSKHITYNTHKVTTEESESGLVYYPFADANTSNDRVVYDEELVENEKGKNSDVWYPVIVDENTDSKGIRYYYIDDNGNEITLGEVKLSYTTNESIPKEVDEKEQKVVSSVDKVYTYNGYYDAENSQVTIGSRDTEATIKKGTVICIYYTITQNSDGAYTLSKSETPVYYVANKDTTGLMDLRAWTECKQLNPESDENYNVGDYVTIGKWFTTGNDDVDFSKFTGNRLGNVYKVLKETSPETLWQAAMSGGKSDIIEKVDIQNQADDKENNTGLYNSDEDSIAYVTYDVTKVVTPASHEDGRRNVTVSYTYVMPEGTDSASVGYYDYTLQALDANGNLAYDKNGNPKYGRYISGEYTPSLLTIENLSDTIYEQVVTDEPVVTKTGKLGVLGGTDSTGFATTSNRAYKWGRYYVEESKAPDSGYYMDDAYVGVVEILANNTIYDASEGTYPNSSTPAGNDMTAITNYHPNDVVYRGGIQLYKHDSDKLTHYTQLSNIEEMLHWTQGDGTLAGAKYTIYNASIPTYSNEDGVVSVDTNQDGDITDGEWFNVGDPILTIETDETGYASTAEFVPYDETYATTGALAGDKLVQQTQNGANDPFISKDVSTKRASYAQGAFLLPYGTYKVVETYAPEGYIYKDTTYYITVYEDGVMYMMDSSNENCDSATVTDKYSGQKTCYENDVIRGGVKVSKSDVERFFTGLSDDTRTQGDTNLTDTQIAIWNNSENEVYVNGQWYEPGDICYVLTITDSNLEVSTAADTLPYGSYYMTEIAAPVGYQINNDWKVDFQIRDDGVIVDATGNTTVDCVTPAEDGALTAKKDFVTGESGTTDQTVSGILAYEGTGSAKGTKTDAECGTELKDQVLRGSVEVEKRDIELDASETMAGNLDDKETMPDLSGIEFTITNASESSILYRFKKSADYTLLDGEVEFEGYVYREVEPGGIVDKIYTFYDEDQAKYVARTDDETLPYGTYTIQETATNDAYLLTDGTARIFQISRPEIEDLSLDETVTSSSTHGQEYYIRKDSKQTTSTYNRAGNSDNVWSLVKYDKNTYSRDNTYTAVADTEHSKYIASSTIYYEILAYVNDIKVTKVADAITDEAKAAITTAVNSGNLYTSNVVEKYYNSTYANEDYDVSHITNDVKAGSGEILRRTNVTEGDAENFYIETYDGSSEMIFKNRIKRGEIAFNKVRSAGKQGMQTLWIVENVTSGEKHVILTDENGRYSSKQSDSMIYHADRTNGLDDLEVTYIDADGNEKTGKLIEVAADSENIIKLTDEIKDYNNCGLWFSTGENGTESAVQNNLGSLPYGTYKLYEVKTESNADFEMAEAAFTVTRDSNAAQQYYYSTEDPRTALSDRTLWQRNEYSMAYSKNTYANGTDVTYENNMIALKSKLTTEDGLKTVTANNGTLKLVDKVTIGGLSSIDAKAGDTLTLVGKIYDVSNKKFITDDEGNEIVAVQEFTYDGTTTKFNQEFEFDTAHLTGSKYVAFEYLYRGSYDPTAEEQNANVSVLATHADETDEDQTVTIPSIHTTLKDKTETDTALDGKFTLKDTVDYEGLTPGKEYTLKGTLMNKATGEALKDADGNEITAETTFTPKKADGTTVVTFEVDKSVLVGKTVVAFEECYQDGIEVAIHADINDEGQTIDFPTPAMHTLAKTDKESKVIQITDEEFTPVTIIDTITYEGLLTDHYYSFVGVLVDTEGNPIVSSAEKDGETAEIVSVSGVFKPTSSNGTAEVTFTLNGNDILETGGKTTVFEYLYDYGTEKPSDDKTVTTRDEDKTPYLEHEDLTDEDQTIRVIRPGENTKIHTTAASENGEKTIVASEKAEIIDTVTYEDIDVGYTYTMKGELHLVNEDGSDGGVLATAEQKFTPEEKNGTMKMKFTFDASELAGRKTVVTETLYPNNATEHTEPLAEHNDLTDEGQTVTVLKPEIKTTATFSDGSKTSNPNSSVTVRDTVTYKNLVVGKEYIMEGELHLIGDDYSDGGVITTSKTTFKPTESSGTVVLEFTFDASELDGKSTVVFEKLYNKGLLFKGDLIAEHSDIKDKDQTVSFKKSVPVYTTDSKGPGSTPTPTPVVSQPGEKKSTGTGEHTLAYCAIGIAGLAIIAIVIAKNRKDKKSAE